jgi:hypothetical protein
MSNISTVREMPIRLPGGAAIRHAIAERAAETLAGSVDHVLGLLGPVEPAFAGGDGIEADWRLAYYQGSRAEHEAIERAMGLVRRTTPLMRVD